MKRTRAIAGLPPSVRRNLAKLGADLSAARRRRRISSQAMAERAFTSRPTISRVERGDPRVSMGIYASVLFVLGMADRLGSLADAGTDEIGLGLEHERLPKRVHMPRRR
jgi:transcriptional regulator with XRE-family HTH domain